MADDQAVTVADGEGMEELEGEVKDGEKGERKGVDAEVLLEAETLEPRADPVEPFFAFIPRGEGGNSLMAKRDCKAQTLPKEG